MKIKSSELPKQILDRVINPDPLEGEDIIIEDDNGKVLGVILQPEAYEFFLKKIEEKEDEMDSFLNEKYDPDSPSLEDLMGE
ncbi:hypothetical protein I6F65_17555 [Pseudoalteromonas sp. SWXJZ94C]|uniref:hypothetical protein n=1 Tax=unclassified Pseudoalteromonas TaxID=194690 RepID=UPI0004171052|nr:MULTISPECIES: hypothetical protein [unclassified Pseudoalteromonas]MBH0058752.1 hypothetical protein [Pseudoalteromonas sp. SWXJZ94C]